MKTPNLKWDSYGVSQHYHYCLILLLFLSCYFNSFAQLAFPTAEGFGKNASGGRGGIVLKVTNLNDSGAGSLRQALQYTSGARTIVFEVGGTITLNSVLSVTNGDVTVAGQTAPGDGILIRGSMVIVEDSNVIMRYIRFRPGNSAANTPDGLNITAWSGTVENIIIDHCSISWADDENLDLRAVGSGVLQNVTIQNCIISEGGYGSLAGPGTFNKTYYKNFFAHNSERNITTNYPTDGTFDFEMINNLVYGYNGATGLALGSKYTILNNHYRESSQVSGYGTIIDHLTSAQNTNGQGTYSETYAYISGNRIPNGTTEFSTNVIPYIRTSPYISSGITPINAIDVADDILPHVGASLPNRDAVDVRLVNQYNSGNGTTASSGTYPTIQGGTPPSDSDNDGMPDYWENENGLNPDNASDRNIVQPDGYTNLEYYLNGMTLGTAGNQVSVSADNNSICIGDEVVLTASGADSYLWDFNNETSSSITVSPDTTTTYTVTGTHSDGNTTQAEITITVNQIPNANAGNDVETCQGTAVTLTASGGTSYQWSTGQTTASITVSPNTTTTYSVEVFQNNCSSIDDVIVNVNQLPNIDAGDDVTIYLGEYATLTATGADSYLWSTGETTESITVNPVISTSYSVTGTINGCENTDTVTVFLVDDSVDANAGQDISICEGETTTLTASGGTTYQWSTGETTASITVNPNITTTYTVTAFSVSGNNSDSDDVTVTVNALPTANAGNDLETCSGTSVTLTASGGSSYLWSNGETTQSISVNPTTTTTYAVEVTQNGCSATDDVVVTVNSLPNVDAGVNVNILQGESTTLTASGAESYLWSTGETTQSITVSPDSTTTYTVTGTTNGCDNTDSVTVVVGNDEIIANAGQDLEICEGNNATLTATGGATYLWSTGETTASITVSPIVTTTYTVTAYDSTGNNFDTDDVIVTVNPLPTIDAGTNSTISLGESITLTASGGDSYLWNTGAATQSITVSPTVTTTYSVTGTLNGCENTDTITVFVDTVVAYAGEDETICNGYSTTLTASGGSNYLWSTGATTQSITVSPSATSTYTVIVSNGSMQDEDDVTVFVNPNPNVVISNGDEVTILEGDYITLSASGANTYQWNNGATQPNIAVNPSVTTSYSVTGYINNCSDSKNITVNVLEPVIAYAGEDQDLCLGEEIVLTATGGSEYLWSTGDTTQSIVVSPEESTEYSVMVYNELDYDEAIVFVSVSDCAEEIIPESPNFEFVVYPNPATNIVNIKISGYQSLTNVYLYDVSGKHLYTEHFSNGDESVINRQLNTSSYSRGIYFLKVIYNDRAITKKVILH